MRKLRTKKNYSLVKSAILTGTLIFSLGSIEFLERNLKEPIPYTEEDIKNNALFEAELLDIENSEINIKNEDLKKIFQYQLGKENITKEDLLTIDSLTIDTKLNDNDFNDLKYLTNLNSLSITDNDIDINDIKYNINLYNLSLTNCNITNINDLSNSVNYLILSNSRILDNYFKTPYDLKILYIRNTTFNNLKIKNPSRLEEISINTTSKFDLNAISTCTNLKDISITKSPNIKNGYILDNFKKENITLDDYAPIWLNIDTFNNINLTDNADSRRISVEIKKLDNIVSSLDLANDDEETKIKKITSYVISALDYDKSEDLESNYNDYPMYFALNEDEGICINYSCLWQALANRAGIDSYQLYSSNHTWNLINNKVYIDPTFIDSGVIVKTTNGTKEELVNVTDITNEEIFNQDKQNMLYFYELNLDDILDTFHEPNNVYQKLKATYEELSNIGYINPNSLSRVIYKDQIRMVELKILMATLLILLMEYKALDKIETIKKKKEEQTIDFTL